MPVLRADRGPVVIRNLISTDLEAAFALSTIAGWNQQPDDWRILFQLASTCAFAAVCDGRVIGTALGLDYGSFSWIAMMLVHPDHRGAGVGGRLLEAALDRLPSDRPVRLDATPLGRPLYQRFGFGDEAALTRHVTDRPRAIPVDLSRVRGMTREDLTRVVAEDRSVFGGSRRSVLEWAFRAAPQLAYVTSGDEGAIGYCFGRCGRLFDQIGPIVAADQDKAAAMVDAAFADARSRPVAIDVFDARGTLGGQLATRGFVVQRPLFRMCLNQRERTTADPSGSRGGRLSEFAIFGPEFG